MNFSPLLPSVMVVGVEMVPKKAEEKDALDEMSSPPYRQEGSGKNVFQTPSHNAAEVRKEKEEAKAGRRDTTPDEDF